MVAFITENMAPIMFFSLIVILILGYPVAFALSAVGLGFAFIGIEFGMFGEAFLRALPDRVFGTMANETLLAIPFFTFMGLILQRSGMAEDLIDTIGQLFGPLRGGIAYAVIFVGALLAAITGVVAASVISMSLIALPIMLRYGYDRYLATGVIMASGTLAQTVPPSINLIVFILGFFLDFFEIAFILVPLLAPAAEALGIDLIWFAVMLAINLQASYLTPPFGFALFFMRSATPARAYTDTVTGKRIEASGPPTSIAPASPSSSSSSS